MSEESEGPKYIVCSKCHCKYINDDENIKKDTLAIKELGTGA
jgi:hypothetical protein